MGPRIIDVHTHIYTPSYLDLLRARTTVPYLLDLPAPALPRLIILPSDDDGNLPPSARGRPIGPEYTSIAAKLAFMAHHGISASVISPANPWLDFLPAREAVDAARMMNDELERICEDHRGKLYAFGILPTTASPDEVTRAIDRLRGLHYIRGVILGTSGMGTGLDDPVLNEVWETLEKAEMPVFLHPHYGLPAQVYGPRVHEYGHVLPLSLGFPMETTIAFTRMWLSGVFDRHARLQILLAHGGGTLPFLAGRIVSCVEHERHFRDERGRPQERRSLSNVLAQNVWLDAVTYSEIGIIASTKTAGMDRVVFGTDHPFFPPLDEGTEDWVSVRTISRAVENSFAAGNGTEKVYGKNAETLLKLDERSE